MDQECEIFRVLFYLYMNIYGDFQICISVPLIFDNNYIWDNSVYTEIKVGVTKQIDSAYFRIIFTQDWTVNSFQGVQGKQNFIWSTGNNGNTTLFHLVCNCKKDVVSLESSVWTWAQQRWLAVRLILYICCLLLIFVFCFKWFHQNIMFMYFRFIQKNPLKLV